MAFTRANLRVPPQFQPHRFSPQNRNDHPHSKFSNGFNLWQPSREDYVWTLKYVPIGISVVSVAVTGWPLCFTEVALHDWLWAHVFADDNLDIPAGYDLNWI